MKNRERIIAALEWLATTKLHKPFVVVEVGDRFVQATGGHGEPLVIDLPTTQVADESAARELLGEAKSCIPGVDSFRSQPVTPEEGADLMLTLLERACGLVGKPGTVAIERGETEPPN